jgi:hypothetical protein
MKMLSAVVDLFDVYRRTRKGKERFYYTLRRVPNAT